MLTKILNYDKFKELYPTNITWDEIFDKNVSVQYFNYFLSETDYDFILETFIKEISSGITFTERGPFIFLLSHEMLDTPFNKKRKFFREFFTLNEGSSSEIFLPLSESRLLKIGILKVYEMNNFIMLLLKIIDKRTPFFFAYSEPGNNIPDVLQRESLINKLKGRPDFRRPYLDKIIGFIKAEKLSFHNIFVFRGGEDFGQFVLFNIPLNKV